MYPQVSESGVFIFMEDQLCIGGSHKYCLSWAVRQWSRFNDGVEDPPPLNVQQPPAEGSCHVNTHLAVLFR
jgi:hypothetical protein